MADITIGAEVDAGQFQSWIDGTLKPEWDRLLATPRPKGEAHAGG